MSKKFRVFSTSDMGDALNVLRERGYALEVYAKPEAPPKKLILEKVKSGIDGLITTLRDQIDAEVFEAGKGTLKVVSQIAVGFDNINRADANRYRNGYPDAVAVTADDPGLGDRGEVDGVRGLTALESVLQSALEVDVLALVAGGVGVGQVVGQQRLAQH